MRSGIYFLSLLLCFSCLNAMAQQEKVGLILSGGGAKGMAHIGVLKALEENQIPIDFITGTSMGGVVGGFYAAGYSPDEIDSIATSEAFLKWISGEIPEKYKYFYLKPANTPKWLEVNLGVDSTLEANFNPKLANDLSLNFELAAHMAPVQGLAERTFDSLFVPFKALGSEVFTQQQILLDHGNLGADLRATMSVPFVYRPIKIDGMYIFDGGIYNNFPVEQMKEYYQPDVMIGVNVASRVYDEYPSAKAEKMISNSLLFMILNKADPKKLGSNGIFITPNMENASGFDFSKAREVIDSGYAATMRQMPEIKANIHRRVDVDSLKTARAKFKSNWHQLKFSDITLEGYTKKQEAFIKKAMFKDQNHGLSIEAIKTNYYKLAAEPFFSDVFPTITYQEEKDSYILALSSSREQKIGLQIGGNMASNNLSNIYLGARLDMLNKYLFNHSLSGQIGSFYKALDYQLRINFAFRHPLYIAPFYTFEKYDYGNINSFIFRQNTENYQTDRQQFGMDFGMPFQRKSKLLISLLGFNNQDEFNETSSFQFTDSIYSYEYYGAAAQLGISYNNLNKRIFPTAGQQFKTSLAYQYGMYNRDEVKVEESKQAFIIHANYQAYYPLSFGSFGFKAHAAMSTISSFDNLSSTLLNTPVYYPTFESQSRFLSNYRAPIFMAFGLIYEIPLFKNAALRTEFHAFKPLVLWNQGINDISWSKLTPDYKLSAMSAFIYHTPIGPVSLSTHYYDTTNPLSIFLNIGYLMFKESRFN